MSQALFVFVTQARARTPEYQKLKVDVQRLWPWICGITSVPSMRPGRTGFAHLFEHIMFQQSKHIGADEHFRLLESAGASDVNGTTGFDRTHYFETVPANELELALWLESDRMGSLLDKLNAEALEQTVGVLSDI